MTEKNSNIDGRTRRALDMAIARKLVSQESYRAVLAGEITLQQAKAMGRDGAPATDARRDHSGPGTATEISGRASAEDGADRPPQPVSRISKDDTTQECWCGCQRLTSPNRRWLPGHDQRAKGIIKRALKEGKVDALPGRLQEYGAERGLI